MLELWHLKVSDEEPKKSISMLLTLDRCGESQHSPDIEGENILDVKRLVSKVCRLRKLATN
ncbi:hypothetical protein J6590_010722 [Homalodisca vitripennis]|nr:hypothetical protein J6590_010722 [Homalodisca vitripennis]